MNVLRRTDLLDTSHLTHRFLVDRIRLMGAEWKIQRVCEIVKMADQIAQVSPRARNPQGVSLDSMDQAFRALRTHGIEPILCGSIAASIWGHPRYADDLDICVRQSFDFTAFQVHQVILLPKFLEMARARSVTVDITQGMHANVVSSEDLVLQKLNCVKSGMRPRDVHWNDLVQVIEIQGDVFDREYLLNWAEHFDLKALAEEALSEARP